MKKENKEQDDGENCEVSRQDKKKIFDTIFRQDVQDDLMRKEVEEVNV